MTSLFRKQKVCVFSGFNGRICYQGSPAVAAKVVRHWSWKDEKGDSDQAITDNNGDFAFPSQWDTMRMILPVQFVSQQSVFVYFQGKKYQIWGAGKLDTDEFSEFECIPKNFRCELTEEVRRVDLKFGVVGTNCHWDQE